MVKYSELTEENKEKMREAGRKWRAKVSRKQYYKDYDKNRSEETKQIRREYNSNLPEEKVSEYNSNRRDKNKGNYPKKTKEQAMFSASQTRAKRLDREHNIKIKDIVIPEFCPVFPWLKLEVGVGRHQPNSPTLDRVNPEEGYVTGNVCVMSFLANSMKRDGTAEMHRLIADFMDTFSGQATH